MSILTLPNHLSTDSRFDLSLDLLKLLQLSHQDDLRDFQIRAWVDQLWDATASRIARINTAVLKISQLLGSKLDVAGEIQQALDLHTTHMKLGLLKLGAPL